MEDFDMAHPLEDASAAPRLVIADDDPSVLKFLADRCTEMGFDVHTAATGLQALIMARQCPPDVMIIDVNMPSLDGLTLSVQLLDSRGKPIEIIVISGERGEENPQRCESFGVLYVNKGPSLWTNVQCALVELFPKMKMIQESRHSSFRVAPPSRPRMLLVDDDQDVWALLSSRLRKCGVEVSVASGGVSGFRTALREKPSLILSEYSMLDGDVNYLLWRLRSAPATDRIPVFVMSDRALDRIAIERLKSDVCGKRGALRVFKKPLDIDELFLALKEHCGLEYKSVYGASGF
jgi:DNA-binding response OmpR family regulator